MGAAVILSSLDLSDFVGLARNPSLTFPEVLGWGPVDRDLDPENLLKPAPPTK
jgi:hypothetical protein